jgi:uncharacterized protein VirK/YbjX
MTFCHRHFSIHQVAKRIIMEVRQIQHISNYNYELKYMNKASLAYLLNMTALSQIFLCIMLLCSPLI